MAGGDQHVAAVVEELDTGGLLVARHAAHQGLASRLTKRGKRNWGGRSIHIEGGGQHLWGWGSIHIGGGGAAVKT